MELTEFQAESDTIGAISLAERQALEDETIPTPGPVEPLSIVMNLSVHGKLSDWNRRWLDELVPDDSLTFLIHGEEYLHPENTPLFPIEVIESSMLDCGASVFSQRFRPEDSATGVSHRILSTTVGNFDDRSLIFGLFGRDHGPTDIRTEMAFSDAVVAFRHAVLSLPELTTRVFHGLQGPEPSCILDRPAGTVLIANSAFAGLVQGDPMTMVGRAFEELADHFPSHFAEGRLRIQNSVVAGYPIAILTVGDMAVKEPPADISRLFFHKLRNKLSAILTSASYLQTIGLQSQDEDEASLAAVIADEATQLNRELDRFELINDYALLPGHSQNLGAELRRTLKALGADTTWTVDTVGKFAELGVVAPDDTLYHLFEAIINTHGVTGSGGSISCSPATDSKSTTIEFVSDSTDRQIGQSTYWTTFLRRLCKLLGARITSPAHEHTSRTITLLTLTNLQDKS